MTFINLLTTAALALALTTTAQAQTAITGNDTAEVLNAARGYGAATLTTQANGDPQIEGKINGITYQIYFRNCTEGANCEDLNFYLGFSDIKPTLEKINEWNFSKRFSRAYLDQVQDACVEMDLDLAKGVSAEYLDSQFSLWNQVIAQYSEFVGYQP